jgi:hypothetical protein
VKCPRCDWRSQPIDDAGPIRDQITAHIDETDHPTCLVCHRILPATDTRTCEACITHARQLLADIVSLYGELESEVGLSRGSSLNDRRSSGDGRPLPGGDALVLLGPGSQGLDEDGVTSRDGDATSVAFELGFWETEWRRARHDQPGRPVRLRGVVRRAGGYLEIHSRWAAQQHPGWVAYVADLRAIAARLERATGRARAASKANASCFDCGGTLVRRLKTVTVEQWWLPGAVGPLPKLLRWTGEIDATDVTCDRCRRAYTPAEYALALRAAGSSGLQGWVTISDAAKVTRRSVDTLKSWTRSRDDEGPGLVSTCCVVAWTPDGRPVQGRQLVWWPDVEKRADRAQRRGTRAS